MADLYSTYQLVLKIVEDFLKRGIEELTEDDKERLTTLREMSEILASILTESGHVKEGASEVNHCIVLIVGFCNTLLFGSYIEILTQLSDRSNMVSEMENKQKEDKSKALPDYMKVKYDQIKRYLEKVNGKLKEIDNMLKRDSELVLKVREAVKNKFKIPDEEIIGLEMDIADLNCEIEACKKYLAKAEEELNTLESDITSETWKFGVKVVGAAAGVTAVITFAGATLAAKEICSFSLSKVSQFLGRGGSIAVGALAGVALSVAIWYIIDLHKTSYRVFVEKLKKKLGELKTECELMEILLFGAASVPLAVAFLMWRGTST